MNRKEASWSWFDQIYEYEFRVFLGGLWLWRLILGMVACGSNVLVKPSGLIPSGHNLSAFISDRNPSPGIPPNSLS